LVRVDYERACCRARLIKKFEGAGDRVPGKEEVLGGEAPRQPYASMIADGSWSADQIRRRAWAWRTFLLGKISRAGFNEHEPRFCVFESGRQCPLWDNRGYGMGLSLGLWRNASESKFSLGVVRLLIFCDD